MPGVTKASLSDLYIDKRETAQKWVDALLEGQGHTRDSQSFGGGRFVQDGGVGRIMALYLSWR